jgi:hypothetical protein
VVEAPGILGDLLAAYGDDEEEEKELKESTAQQPPQPQPQQQLKEVAEAAPTPAEAMEDDGSPVEEQPRYVLPRMIRSHYATPRPRTRSFLRNSNYSGAASAPLFVRAEQAEPLEKAAEQEAVTLPRKRHLEPQPRHNRPREPYAKKQKKSLMHKVPNHHYHHHCHQSRLKRKAATLITFSFAFVRSC